MLILLANRNSATPPTMAKIQRIAKLRRFEPATLNGGSHAAPRHQFQEQGTWRHSERRRRIYPKQPGGPSQIGGSVPGPHRARTSPAADYREPEDGTRRSVQGD